MTGYRIISCRVCGKAPGPWVALQLRYVENGEPLCVLCSRWFLAWSLGLVVAADQLAWWGFARWRTPSEWEG